MSRRPKPPTARVENTLDMWAEGKTAQAISMALADGTTRNAVIGIVSRARAKGAERAQQRYASPVTPRYKPRVPKMNSIMVVQTPPIIDEPEPEGIEHVEARPNQCKWFLRGQSGASGKVCGCKVVPGKSWCPSHYRRAFVAQRVKVAA